MGQEHIKLQPMGTGQIPAPGQSPGKQTSAPSIRQGEITFTALRSLGKKIDKNQDLSEEPLFKQNTENLQTICNVRSPIYPNDGSLLSDVKKVIVAWGGFSQGILEKHTKSSDERYVKLASNALFVQWEASKLKSKFLEIVNYKLSGIPVPEMQVGFFKPGDRLYKATPPQEEISFETEFEVLVSELYSHTTPNKTLTPTDKIVQLLLPEYSTLERQKVLDYMYQSREKVDLAKTKASLQIFSQNPSSYKLVLVVENGKKFLEVQKLSFIERLLHSFFNVETTEWGAVLGFLKDGVDQELKAHANPRLEQLMREHVGIQKFGYTVEDVMFQHNEAIQVLFNDKKTTSEKQATAPILNEIIENERELLSIIENYGALSNLTSDSSEFSEKEFIEKLQAHFSVAK